MEVMIDGYVYNCSNKLRFVEKGQYVIDGNLFDAPGHGYLVKDWVPTRATIAYYTQLFRKKGMLSLKYSMHQRLVSGIRFKETQIIYELSFIKTQIYEDIKF